jgi:hypothetical protein
MINHIFHITATDQAVQLHPELAKKAFIGHCCGAPNMEKFATMARYNRNRAFVRKLLHDIRRFGVGSFVFDRVEECAESDLERVCNEQMIAADSIQNGYNASLFTLSTARQPGQAARQPCQAIAAPPADVVDSIKITRFPRGYKVHWIKDGKHSSRKFFDREAKLDEAKEEAAKFAESLDLGAHVEHSLGAESVTRIDTVRTKLEQTSKATISQCAGHFARLEFFQPGGKRKNAPLYHVTFDKFPTLSENICAAQTLSKSLGVATKVSYNVRKQIKHSTFPPDSS